MIVMTSKQKRILSFFGRKNKREEHRPQMETSGTDNVDEDELSDADEQNFCWTWLKPKQQGETLSLPGWKNSIIKKY